MRTNGRVLDAPAVRPEPSFGQVAYWRRAGLACVWCEHPMLNHLKVWRDGARWRAHCGGADHGTPCECVNPVAEVVSQ